MDILQEVNQMGITVIIVTHENDIAHRTQRIIRLRDGIIGENKTNGNFQPVNKEIFTNS
jgi:putative ABC transport system ATP-binding protein